MYWSETAKGYENAEGLGASKLQGKAVSQTLPGGAWGQAMSQWAQTEMGEILI